MSCLKAIIEVISPKSAQKCETMSRFWSRAWWWLGISVAGGHIEGARQARISKDWMPAAFFWFHRLWAHELKAGRREQGGSCCTAGGGSGKKAMIYRAAQWGIVQAFQPGELTCTRESLSVAVPQLPPKTDKGTTRKKRGVTKKSKSGV